MFFRMHCSIPRLQKTTGVAHTSFLHPAHTESEFPRESIEVRAIAFYDE